MSEWEKKTEQEIHTKTVVCRYWEWASKRKCDICEQIFESNWIWLEKIGFYCVCFFFPSHWRIDAEYSLFFSVSRWENQTDKIEHVFFLFFDLNFFNSFIKKFLIISFFRFFFCSIEIFVLCNSSNENALKLSWNTNLSLTWFERMESMNAWSAKREKKKSNMVADWICNICSWFDNIQSKLWHLSIKKKKKADECAVVEYRRLHATTCIYHPIDTVNINSSSKRLD